MENHQNLIQENREYLIKQNEMLQAVIAQMANNSLMIKQLGFTTWTALVGFGFTNKTSSLFILALISSVFMEFLDIYYLLLERRFRNSFNHLTEMLCGFDNQALAQIQKAKGNFVKPAPLVKTKAFQIYLNTLNSWVNLPYLVIISITLITLSMSLPE